MPSLSGVYFISGSDRSVQLIIEDFKYQPLYKTAHIFFSSRVSPSQLQDIKACPGLLSRLRSLKEVKIIKARAHAAVLDKIIMAHVITFAK